MKTILLLFALLSSAAAQSLTDNARTKEQILSVLRQQVDGWNNGDIESFMQGYEKSDSLRFASGGTVTYGWKNMLDRYKKTYSTKEQMGVLTFTTVTVDIVSKDAAAVFGTWRLKREKDELWGLFTLLFKNSVWQIVHDHTSSGN